MRKFASIVISTLLLIAGCNASENDKTETINTSKSKKISENKDLTPEYLLGAWCYTHYQYTDPSTKIVDRQEENINFVFTADGTYTTQNNPGTPMAMNGKYEFLPNGIFKFYIGSYTVVSVDPDIFILHKQVDHFFSRGACK